MSTDLMINAAATLRTFGYLQSAIIVSKFPARPVIIIRIAATAANVLRGFGNLKEKLFHGTLFHNELSTLSGDGTVYFGRAGRN